ncbi:MAG TPA: arylesterase [Crenotrichaceae bacterium]|nr:arylesterase [Crenotrichaceae bacterium]
MFKLHPLFLLLCLCLTVQNVNSQTILVFGDSLSAAYKLDPADGWVQLLQNKSQQQQLGLTYINASISGETTRGGLSRFKKALDKHHPDIVILELGANDGLRGFPPKVIQSNLERMIKLARKQQAKLLLVGIHLPPNYGRHYTEMFHKIYVDLAKQYNLTLLPYLLKGVGTNKSLMQTDGLHPKANAQPLIASTVWDKLSPLITPQRSSANENQPGTRQTVTTSHSLTGD